MNAVTRNHREPPTRHQNEANHQPAADPSPANPGASRPGPRFNPALAETAWKEAQTMNVFCRMHPLAALRPLMTAEGLIPARNLRRLRSGCLVRVAGLSVMVHMPPTRSGRRIMFVTLEDETGLMDLIIFSELQERAAQEILTSQVLAVEGRLKRDGRMGRSISVTAQEIIPEFTGSLTGLLVGSLGRATDDPTRAARLAWSGPWLFGRTPRGKKTTDKASSLATGP